MGSSEMWLFFSFLLLIYFFAIFVCCYNVFPNLLFCHISLAYSLYYTWFELSHNICNGVIVALAFVFNSTFFTYFLWYLLIYNSSYPHTYHTTFNRSVPYVWHMSSTWEYATPFGLTGLYKAFYLQPSSPFRISPGQLHPWTPTLRLPMVVDFPYARPVNVNITNWQKIIIIWLM